MLVKIKSNNQNIEIYMKHIVEKKVRVNFKKKSKVLILQARDLIKKNINIKKITKHFNDEGIIIIKNVLNKQKCNFFINLLEKNYTSYKHSYFTTKKKKIPTHSQDYNAKTVSNLHNKDIKFLKFLDHPIILPLVTSFLQQGSYMKSDKIICQSLVARSPIGKCNCQQLHNDARLIGSYFPLVIQVMWTLDRFTKNNGSTRFVIGSHRFMKFPKNRKVYNGEIVAEVPSGSAIIFNAALWHGSSKIKTSPNRRWGIICRYARWFLKPSFDFNFNTPAKIYKRLNSFQKELLGFKFNPPKDEFERTSARSKKPIKPKNYYLPKRFRSGRTNSVTSSNPTPNCLVSQVPESVGVFL